MQASHQQLLDLGYVIHSVSGVYCSAWNGERDVLLRWAGGAWIVL